jgi:hypothetical protein
MNHHIKYFGPITLISLLTQACKAPAIGIASAAILGGLLHQFGWYGFVFAFVGVCLALMIKWLVGMIRRVEF